MDTSKRRISEFDALLTVNAENSFIWDGRPEFIRGVTDIFALILLQGFHCYTEGEEYEWARTLSHLQLWVIARVKLLSILCPPETRKTKVNTSCSDKYRMVINDSWAVFHIRAVQTPRKYRIMA